MFYTRDLSPIIPSLNWKASYDIIRRFNAALRECTPIRTQFTCIYFAVALYSFFHRLVPFHNSTFSKFLKVSASLNAATCFHHLNFNANKIIPCGARLPAMEPSSAMITEVKHGVQAQAVFLSQPQR
jgi:hypothetical protein